MSEIVKAKPVLSRAERDSLNKRGYRTTFENSKFMQAMTEAASKPVELNMSKSELDEFIEDRRVFRMIARSQSEALYKKLRSKGQDHPSAYETAMDEYARILMEGINPECSRTKSRKSQRNSSKTR